jgi:aryl-alcohol dehydrogenase-like predicted oxidoreductase
MDTDNLPEKLATIKPTLQTLHTVCKSYNIPIGSIALNFAMENEYIDKVIVGVDTLQQLQQNINVVTYWQPKAEVVALVKKINIADKKLLNPANW